MPNTPLMIALTTVAKGQRLSLWVTENITFTANHKINPVQYFKNLSLPYKRLATVLQAL
jgi:hypothetical protein